MLCMVVATTNSIFQGRVPSYAWLAVLMFGWGLTGGVWANLNQVLIQEITPADRIGRVMGVVALMTTGLAPMGSLAAGAVSSAIGPQRTISVFGLVGLCCVLTVLWRSPALRRMA